MATFWGSQQAGKVISLATYREDKRKARALREDEKSAVLNWFERLDRYEPVIWAIIMLSCAYVAAQCVRWLM